MTLKQRLKVELAIIETAFRWAWLLLDYRKAIYQALKERGHG